MFGLLGDVLLGVAGGIALGAVGIGAAYLGYKIFKELTPELVNEKANELEEVKQKRIECAVQGVKPELYAYIKDKKAKEGTITFDVLGEDSGELEYISEDNELEGEQIRNLNKGDVIQLSDD